jgi:hypothetical protein
MERAVYSVFLREQGWIIQFDGKQFGPCSSRELALSVALRAAKMAREMGFDVQIMAHDGAQFRTVWFNGKQSQPRTEPPFRRHRGPSLRT